jgi:hypothetical protein
MATNSIINYFKFCINVFLYLWLILLFSNIIDVLSNEVEYHFSIFNEYQQPFNWIYRSTLNYLIFIIINILYILLIIIIGFHKKHIIYFMLLALYLILVILLYRGT